MKTEKYIYIQGDTNDGDYISEFTPITEEQLEQIRPIIKAVKRKKGHNWANEYSDETLAELYPEFHEENPEFGKNEWEQEFQETNDLILFQEFVPWGEYGIHTITEIKIFTVTNVEELL